MDKIICLGKNYSDHTAEMKEAQPEKPVLFLKPPSCYKELKKGEAITLPWSRGNIHYECEVVLKLYKKNVIAVSLGLDLTLRELQAKLKSQGHPWEISKCFKNSALCAPFIGQRDFINWREEPFALYINGELKQQSSLPKAILSPDAAIHHANDFFPICDGDLVFTGTPSGVGPLSPNDVVNLSWGPIQLEFRLADEYK